VRGRLFWRVYLYGLLLLVALGATFVAVGAFMQRRWSPPSPPDRLLSYYAQELGALQGDPAALTLRLQALQQSAGLTATIYRADGTLLATGGSPPAPFSRETTEPGHHWHDGLLIVPVSLGPAGPGVLSARLHRPGPPPSPANAPHVVAMAAQLAALLLILAVLSAVLARALTRPIERLTRAARALGAGDLQARAQLRRGDELGELAVAFDDMADQLAGLLESKKELLASVSHELRTPLASIRVALELARERVPEADRYLVDVDNSARELEALVSDLLTAARLDASGALPGATHRELRLEPVEPAQLVDELARRFRQRHPDRELRTEVAPGLPSVELDAPLVTRLFDNLLENACTYSDRGSAIALAARNGSGGLTISVQDRGIGIEAEHLDRLFQPFFRTDRSRARHTGGTGLGLHIAKRIAESHQASLEVQSAVGEGTTFTFTVPLSDRGASSAAG
jgi:signal transduction histidine kinase